MRLAEFKFTKVGSNVSDPELNAFEKEIGGVIDNDLKEFLLEINGGLARPEIRSSIPALEFEISSFLGLESDYTQLRRAFFDIEESFDEFAPNEAKVVPFTLDFGDGAICVILGKKNSEVVYVPTVNSVGDDDIDVSVIVVSATFNDFVETLTQAELED